MKNKHQFQKITAYKVRKTCNSCGKKFTIGTRGQIYCKKCGKNKGPTKFSSTTFI